MYNAKADCHNNIDGFCNRKDMTSDYKNKRIGAALSYITASKDVFKDDRGRCHSRDGKFTSCDKVGGSRDRVGMTQDSRGRCHGEDGKFVSCSKVGGSRDRVGQSYGSRGYQGDFIKDSRGRCHAEESTNGYRAGQFIPCPDQ
jgi:hypothetical protein